MRFKSLPVEQLTNWALLNGVDFTGVSVESQILTSDGTDKGGGLQSTSILEPEDVVLTVPGDLVVCKDTVFQCAKIDRHLREVLEAAGDFGHNPRKAILIFLLMQLFYSSPDSSDSQIGAQNPLRDYVNFLPKEIPLPTFYSDQERELLQGTSLADALDQKLSSLEQEFAHLQSATQDIEWCRRLWWDEETGQLTFLDWKLVDAMYRSRALELPRGVGDAMVPCVDMCNHASDDTCNARFEVDLNNQILLLIRDHKAVQAKQEITIMYGVGGACEMMFSYGFLEDAMSSAREMFLSLSIPSDDPLRLAKSHFANEAPGVRIYLDNHGQVRWDSGFVWWACVNEEDGLDFRVIQTVNGEKELEGVWKGERFEAAGLKDKLLADPMKDIFLLRAVVTILDRVERQGEELQASQAAVDACSATGHQIRGFVLDSIQRLRSLEMDLLSASFGSLETQKQELLNTDGVSAYLSGVAGAGHQSEGAQEEEFS